MLCTVLDSNVWVWVVCVCVPLQFVAAMGPPGGGRSRITQRYVRHFNVVGFVPFDKDSLTRIFSTIVQWCLGEWHVRWGRECLC